MITRTIVKGPLVTKSQLQSHTFLVLQLQDHTFSYLPRHQSIIPLNIPFQYLASRKQPMKYPPFGCCIAKRTWLPNQRLDQKEIILGSALIKVTVVACLGQKRATFIRNLPAYSKPPSIEARCLACWRQQIEIAGGKCHSCSFLSFVIGADVAEMHKKLTLSKSDIQACNSVKK